MPPGPPPVGPAAMPRRGRDCRAPGRRPGAPAMGRHGVQCAGPTQTWPQPRFACPVPGPRFAGDGAQLRVRVAAEPLVTPKPDFKVAGATSALSSDDSESEVPRGPSLDPTGIRQEGLINEGALYSSGGATIARHVERQQRLRLRGPWRRRT